jgi:phage shock protein PspC (stress-responsive transcriptional regulator)
MDTMHAAAPTRPRWFAGLQRSRSRLLGGVAGGFAEFWEVDPLLVRVLGASPLLAAMVAFVGQVVLGLYWTVPVTQLLWLISAGTIAAYLLGWMLIPQPEAASLARRFLAWGGPLGTLAKLTVGFVLLFGFGWLGLGTLGYVGALDDLSPLVYVTGMLVTVGGLATLGVWLARGGDLRDALHRLGSPGFGRTAPSTPAAWVDPAAGEGDPTLVLNVDGEPTVTMPAPDPTSGEPTLVLDSVDRARAAATAAADARAAAADAQRRARAEERRARRAERRERNRWGWLVAAVTLIAAGTLVLTDRAAVTGLGWAGIAMICLTLLTTGVLVGAWFGSARWLIAPALLLAGLIAGGAVATEALDAAASAPPISVAPETLPARDLGGMNWEEGAVTVNLTGTKVLDSRALALSVDRGSLTVIIPKGQWTEISSSVSWGRNNLTPEGMAVFTSGGHQLNMPAEPQPDDAPLFLDLHVGVGELTVIEQES